MLILKYDNGKLLPPKVQKRVNDFIDNVKKIKWFEPDPNITKEEVEKQVNFILECFGVKAKIQYKKWLKGKYFIYDCPSSSYLSFDSCYDSVWASAMNLCSDYSWDCINNSDLFSARDLCWDLSFNLSWKLARNSADLEKTLDLSRTLARTSMDILLQNNRQFKLKYPNGAFRQLFKLWEMGLYPVGILKNKKFVIYAKPTAKNLFKK